MIALNRRNFLFGATLLAAPAVVRASSLMKLWVPPKRVLMSDLTGVDPDFYRLLAREIYDAYVLRSNWRAAYPEFAAHWRALA